MIARIVAAAVVSAVTVASAVAPAVSVAAADGYSDVSGVHAPSILRLAADGVLKGTDCAPGKFCPSDPLPRWLMAVWLTRVLDLPSADPFGFVDTGGVDFTAEIDALAAAGITRGCATDPPRYCPDKTVTREQMSSFLVRAFDLPTAEEPAGFSDISGSSHAADINTLAAAGITRGCATEPLRYCPGNNVSRAQMATFLVRAAGLDPISEAAEAICDISEEIPSAVGSVFQVRTGSAIGTAFYIGGGEWMTAAHVVAGAVGIRLVNGSHELQAEVVGIDHAADIALLEASGDGIEPLAFADTDVGLGEGLAVLGFPLYVADTPSVTTGVASRIEQHLQLGTVILTDAAVNPGNSGGPLIGNCGTVLGMVVEKWVEDAVEGISYAIATSTLNQRIDDVRNMTPSVGAVQPAGADWEFFEGENIRGTYTGVATSVDVSTSPYRSQWLSLFVRCTNRSLDIFFVHDGAFFFGDGVWINYRFGNQTEIVGAWGDLGTGDDVAFLLDTQSFLADLRADTSGTLFVDLYDYVDYTYIEDTYDYEGGGQLGVRGVAQDVEPILQKCGY